MALGGYVEDINDFFDEGVYRWREDVLPDELCKNDLKRRGGFAASDVQCLNFARGGLLSFGFLGW